MVDALKIAEGLREGGDGYPPTQACELARA
jgi:hypothetical protein